MLDELRRDHQIKGILAEAVSQCHDVTDLVDAVPHFNVDAEITLRMKCLDDWAYRSVHVSCPDLQNASPGNLTVCHMAAYELLAGPVAHF